MISQSIAAMLPSSNLPYVDVSFFFFFGSRWIFLTVSQVFSSKSLGGHHFEASYCNIVHLLLHHVEENLNPKKHLP